jgi:SAM-dependent methyltransferase
MSQADRDKWNQRYRDGAYVARKHPSDLLAGWLPRLTPTGGTPRALDVASGSGRNTLYLASQGWRVCAVDISEVALGQLAATAAQEGHDITCIRRDLEAGKPRFDDIAAAGPFDLAVVIRYTNLPLLAKLVEVLAPGGYLLVESHLQTDADVVGPSDQRFRVAPGELRAAAAGLEVVACHEGIVEDPDRRRAALAQLIARKPA